MKRTYLPLALTSIVLWSFLGYLGAELNRFPPLLITGMALTLSGLLSLFRARHWKIPLKTLFVGVGGIFGYHAFYFSALHHAPAVEANLVNYLWPLLIVLFTPLFFRSRRLRGHHLLGAFLGFAGAALVITQGRFAFCATHLPGYLFALLAAVTWAGYSLTTKKLAPFPSSAVGAFCLVSGVLALALFSTRGDVSGTLARLDPRDWINLILLGLGPLGFAFFTWDAALKRGDPRVIGALTYLTPLLSTFILVKVGSHPFTLPTAFGMAAIVTGAALGSLDLFQAGKAET